MPASTIGIGNKVDTGRSASDPASRAVFQEQISLIKRNIPDNMMMNLVLVPVFLFLIWWHAPTWVVVTWAILMLAILVSRWLIAQRFNNIDIDAADLSHWYKLFLIGAAITGMAWGIAGLLMEYYNLEEYHGLVVFILAGLAAGAISTNSAVFSIYVVFLMSMLIPIISMYILKGDSQHMIMGGMTSFFIVMMLIVARRYNIVIKDGILRRLKINEVMEDLKESEQRFRDVAMSSSDWIWEVDCDARYIFAAGRVKEILGRTSDEMIGRTPFEFMPAEEAERVKGLFQAACASKLPIVDLEWTIFRHDAQGEHRTCILSNGVPVLDSDGNIAGYRGVDRDITDRKNLEERLSRMATCDPLTGLYNRGELDRVLVLEAKRAARYSYPLSVMMLDIDHFKRVNDACGHQAGDKVLIKLAAILTKNIRDLDHIGRFGGEEFVLLLPGVDSEGAHVVAERIRHMIENTPISIDAETDINITISIGVASCPKNATNKDGLISAADKALYKAKESGRNRVCIAGN
jgi:diguanylate cyclase (GGDEF)-like protein/PAS domain S-box-containing protein